MNPTAAPIRHPRLAAAGLSTAIALTAVSVALQPDLAGDPTQTLVALASGPLPAVSAVSFLLSQLPFIVAYLAIGALVETRHRRLGLWATCLAVLGAFGHTVFGGMSLIYLVMAHDPAHHVTYAVLMSDIQDTPVMLFSLIGLAGTITGILALSIGLFRTHIGPRWIGPALWTFLVLEFVAGGISRYAGYVAVICLGAAFLAIATHILTTTRSAPTPAPTAAPEPATQAT